MKVRIAVLGSGNGSNAENIYTFFKSSKYISVVCFVSNNKSSYITIRAKKIGLPCFILTKKTLSNISDLESFFYNLKVDWLILAGFLIKIPQNIVSLYPNKILNLHPSLLPKYGGKGMYGDNVHKAVLKNGEKESGITIHYVNSEYDKGKILFQESISITKDETAKSLKEKINALELKFYPRIIESVIIEKCQ